MEKKDNEGKLISRRQFIGSSFALAAGLAAGTKSVFGAPAFLKNLGKPNSMIKGVQIGTITYSYRSMPDQSAGAILKYIVDSGINAIELMGEPAEEFAGKPKNPVDFRTLYGLYGKQRKGTLTGDEKKQLADMRKQMMSYDKQAAKWRTSVSMDKFAQLRKMYNDAGVNIYAWKPNAFGKNNSDAEINYAFNAAKALGATACTTEHPGDDAQTKRLGDIAARHKIYMAYHAHTQASPTLWDTALKQSPWNAVNLDEGHWVAAGNPSPLPFIREKHDRIESIHLKDRTTPAHGSKNLVWGTGDTPIVQTLQLMRNQHYTFPGSIELEYDIPDGSDAVKEVIKCLDYCRKALNG